MDFYSRLKDSIAQDHEATENIFQPPLFSDKFKGEDFKRFLLSNYIFFRSHELYFSGLSLPEEAEALLRPSRADMLESDLNKLRVNTEDVPLLTDSLAAGEPEQADTAALGHVYVLAGSAMGAKIIAKHMRSKPFVVDGEANSFLESHAYFRSEDWKNFKQLLNSIDNKKAGEAVTDAARRSFGYFSDSYDLATTYLNKEKTS